MKTAAIAATAAVVGALATTALVKQTPESGNFLQATPMAEEEYAFMQFISEYRRFYGTKEEYEYRLDLFRETYNFVKEHNAGDHKFTVAINKFADYNEAERKQLTGHISIPRDGSNVVYLDETSTPSSVDWRSKGAVTPVKDQGSCGSCWSFATTGAVEGAEYIKTGKLTSLSEQQLVDCSGSYGNHGCNGGNADRAFKYIESHPLTTESNYPYKGKTGSCNTSKQNQGKYGVRGYKDVASDNESQFQTAVAHQPIAVAIEADTRVFQSYHSGILDSSSCGTRLDHAVLTVGYGQNSKGEKYWIVKNSWGKSWGEDGYVKIERTSGKGICGINMEPSYPTE